MFCPMTQKSCCDTCAWFGISGCGLMEGLDRIADGLEALQVTLGDKGLNEDMVEKS